MAGDWIKLRVWLHRDPKVIRMASHLIDCERFRQWLAAGGLTLTENSNVTRNVTVSLCVTGLGVTWGTAREQGDCVDDDLVVSHCDLNTLDAITDIPGFGAAMAFVGWAIEREDGALVFPKFFRDNVSPDEKHKSQNAQRQARYREKKAEKSNVTRNVTRNVTVTDREEKRREEIIKGEYPLNNPPTTVSQNAGFPHDNQGDPLSEQRPSDEAAEILVAWNRTPGVHCARGINRKRRTALAVRLREPDWSWREALAKFPLACYPVDARGWRPNLDWFLRAGTVGAILEGHYDWKPADQPAVTGRGAGVDIDALDLGNPTEEAA